MIDLYLVSHGDGKDTYKDKDGYLYCYSKQNISCLRRRPNATPARFFNYNVYTKINIQHFLDTNAINLQIVELANDAKSKSMWICPIHGKFFMSWNVLQRNLSCPFCARRIAVLKKTNTLDYIKKEAMKRYGVEVISKSYLNNESPLNFICTKHPDIVQTKSWTNMQKYKNTCCSVCLKDNRVQKSNLKKMEKINSIYNGDISVLEFEEKDLVLCICNKCGSRFKQYYRHIINGHGCNICTKSIGENIIKKILDDLNIDYVQQKSFKECKNIRRLLFDFYLPSKNTVIEFNGIQHYKPIERFGGSDSFAEQFKRDSIKKDFCCRNNIKFLEIKYTMKYDEILEKLKDSIGD